MRISEYFGAVTVDSLDDAVCDSRLDNMLEECFNIKPERRREKTPVVESLPTEPEEPEIIAPSTNENNTYILINAINVQN